MTLSPDAPLAPRRGPLPEARPLTHGDLRAALAAGWSDMRRAPVWGLGFAAVLALGGMALTWLGAGLLTWTLVMSLGFPLVAPFLATGLYEVSRRIEAGLPLTPREILGVVAAEGNRQMPWMGMMLLLIFLFWSFFAHMLFALFLGPQVLLAPHSAGAMLGTPSGAMMLAAQAVAGGAVALLTFGLTAFGIPMLLDREVDLVTASMASLRAVRANARVMLPWAALIAVLTVLAMLPAFLGLLVVLPLLGHATWHLYRRAYPA